jgi:Flp pilus assembly protein TadG
MKSTRRVSILRGSASGQVMPMVAAGILLFLGMGALAIDVGLVLLARAEAQRTADAAALAGAGVLVGRPLDASAVRAEAMDIALQNPIRGVPTALQPSDVVVIADSQKVRVQVQRSTDRGNGIETLFARVLGVSEVSVRATATAQAWSASGVNCLMPFTLPDRWSESASQPFVWPTETDRYDPADADIYIPWDPANPDAAHTGYGAGDLGLRIRLRTTVDSESFQPGWFFAIRLPGGSGGSSYRNNIEVCADPSVLYQVGTSLTVTTEPGNMTGPTRQGFQALYNLDPGAYWDDTCRCVLGSAYPVSPRIRPVGLFDPRFPPPSGASPFRITNFVAVFVEAPPPGGSEFWVRFVQTTGILPAPAWSPGTPSLIRVLRLVE